jgi:EAL domain-containing protein (putative c-di-GMP-specific phosphodiesterase class I)
MAVNLSARQLRSPRLVSDVAEALAAGGLDTGSLCLELTETALMEADNSTRESVETLARMGIAIALDDFGTGMSSLAHLRTFPISVVKIDRSFIAGLDDNRSDTAVVRAVIGLGLGMGVEVIAEGVETQRQADLLLELGCTQAQGFFYGRPGPA